MTKQAEDRRAQVGDVVGFQLTVRNFAVVGSASHEPVLRDSAAVAAAVQVQPEPGSDACNASAAPRARAACGGRGGIA